MHVPFEHGCLPGMLWSNRNTRGNVFICTLCLLLWNYRAPRARLVRTTCTSLLHVCATIVQRTASPRKQPLCMDSYPESHAEQPLILCVHHFQPPPLGSFVFTVTCSYVAARLCSVCLVYELCCARAPRVIARRLCPLACVHMRIGINGTRVARAALPRPHF